MMLFIISRNLHEVKIFFFLFIKIRPTVASLSQKRQVNMHTTVNGQLRFQAALSSSVEKVSSLRLVTSC